MALEGNTALRAQTKSTVGRVNKNGLPPVEQRRENGSKWQMRSVCSAVAAVTRLCDKLQTNTAEWSAKISYLNCGSLIYCWCWGMRTHRIWDWWELRSSIGAQSKDRSLRLCWEQQREERYAVWREERGRLTKQWGAVEWGCSTIFVKDRHCLCGDWCLEWCGTVLILIGAQCSSVVFHRQKL